MVKILEELKRLDVEQKIRELLFIENAKEGSIEWGMNYITFAPSKMIRPLLILEANLAFSQVDHDSYILASAIELVHTYSLVHDDLPCMDDDELRRGLKTLHVIKDEAYALLVGDSLLSRSFGILAGYSKKEKLPEIIDLFYKKTGPEGILLGQIKDLNGEGKKLKEDEIHEINQHKTASLFELALILGALNAGAAKTQIEDIEKLGTLIGHIFQIQDDILDIIGNEEIMGKKAGSDEKKDKSSLPLITGIDKAKELIYTYRDEACRYIEELPANRDFFYSLLDFLINRIK